MPNQYPQLVTKENLFLDIVRYIFDRIFGTYLDLDKNIEANFGILTPPNSFNPLVIVTFEYSNIWKDVKSANTFKENFVDPESRKSK